MKSYNKSIFLLLLTICVNCGECNEDMGCFYVILEDHFYKVPVTCISLDQFKNDFSLGPGVWSNYDLNDKRDECDCFSSCIDETSQKTLSRGCYFSYMESNTRETITSHGCMTYDDYINNSSLPTPGVFFNRSNQSINDEEGRSVPLTCDCDG